MKPEEALAKLKQITESQQCYGDTESEHAEADKILCSLISHLGYPEIAAEFDSLIKWYS
jgi:hypothetical protein